MDNDKKVPHYKVFMGGSSGCIYKKLSEAIEDIAMEMENDLLGDIDEDETSNYHIKIKYMSYNEFEELPEWNGW